MASQLNIEEIKQYNNVLRQTKERASKIEMEINYKVEELNKLCAELTNELGIQVTPENLNQIYEDRVARINETLVNGKEILKRIAEEENLHIQNTTTPNVQEVTPQQIFNSAEGTNTVSQNNQQVFDNSYWNL